MVDKDRTLFGTIIYNYETKAKGILLYTWINKFADGDINFATCVDENGKKYNIKFDKNALLKSNNAFVGARLFLNSSKRISDDDEIFGVKTIKTSNGTNVENIMPRIAKKSIDKKNNQNQKEEIIF